MWFLKNKERKKKVLCAWNPMHVTLSGFKVQTIIPLNLNVGIHVYGLDAIVVGMDGFKKHQRFTKKNRNNGKEPLVSWLTVLFSQCHTHDKWNFGNVDEEEVMMTLVIREIECVEFFF